MPPSNLESTKCIFSYSASTRNAIVVVLLLASQGRAKGNGFISNGIRGYAESPLRYKGTCSPAVVRGESGKIVPALAFVYKKEFGSTLASCTLPGGQPVFTFVKQ